MNNKLTNLKKESKYTIPEILVSVQIALHDE